MTKKMMLAVLALVFVTGACQPRVPQGEVLPPGQKAYEIADTGVVRVMVSEDFKSTEFCVESAQRGRVCSGNVRGAELMFSGEVKLSAEQLHLLDGRLATFFATGRSGVSFQKPWKECDRLSIYIHSSK